MFKVCSIYDLLKHILQGLTCENCTAFAMPGEQLNIYGVLIQNKETGSGDGPDSIPLSPFCHQCNRSYRGVKTESGPACKTCHLFFILYI